jgi:hypothetical protein
MKLLTEGNTKTVKGEKMGYKTYILHLAPSKLSGYQVCPMASAGCKAACLNTSGRGRFPRIQEARIRKTKWFFENRDTFMEQLVKDIEAGIRKADREGFIPVFRLNGTSDIRWENIPVNDNANIMEAFPEYQFYDYTKISNRSNIPDNYHLTFSLSESNLETSKKMARAGYNVAVVFEKELPTKYMALPVIDGTETDLRFLDPENSVVGLVAKGKAKKDKTNFVVRV